MHHNRMNNRETSVDALDFNSMSKIIDEGGTLSRSWRQSLHCTKERRDWSRKLPKNPPPHTQKYLVFPTDTHRKHATRKTHLHPAQSCSCPGSINECICPPFVWDQLERDVTKSQHRVQITSNHWALWEHTRPMWEHSSGAQSIPHKTRTTWREGDVRRARDVWGSSKVTPQQDDATLWLRFVCF